MAAAQLGFLHSTTKGDKVSRLDRIQKTGGPSGLPDLGQESYLFEAFIIMRPVTITAYGPAPRDWPVVEAFASATGIVSEGWEKRALMDMSETYVSELVRGEDAFTIPPVERE